MKASSSSRTRLIFFWFIFAVEAVDRESLELLRKDFGYDKVSLAELTKITIRLESAQIVNSKKGTVGRLSGRSAFSQRDRARRKEIFESK